MKNQMTKYKFYNNCHKKIYGNNSHNDYYNLIKDSQIQNIKNLEKRLSESIDFDYIEDSSEEFIELFKLYHDIDSLDTNFKEIFDEITKKVIKVDNLSMDYLSNLVKIISPFLSHTQFLEAKLVQLRGELARYNELIDCISELMYKNDNINNNYISKSGYYTNDYFNDLMFKKYFDFKELKHSLFNRIIILFFSKHYQRKLYSSIEIISAPEAYVNDIIPRYSIPKQDYFTLNDIASIYAESSSNSRDSSQKNIYDRLRKIVLEIGISDLHKTESNDEYQIPYNRVINYLAELEIRQTNNKKINQKTITKKNIEDLENKKSTNFNYENFQRIAARETGKSLINNRIRDFQNSCYTHLINSCNFKNLF